MAISRICLVKRLHSPNPQQLQQSAPPSVGLTKAPSSKQADVDASIQSLLQAACQSIRKADHTSPSQQAASKAADMLAWNVLMALYVSSALPSSAKQHLQKGTVASCQALLHLSSPEHASTISLSSVDCPSCTQQEQQGSRHMQQEADLGQMRLGGCKSHTACGRGACTSHSGAATSTCPSASSPYLSALPLSPMIDLLICVSVCKHC